MIPLSSDHLWGSIARGSTSCLESSSLLIHVTETKIDNLESEIIIQQQIFGLEISMADPTLVDILNTGNKLEIKFTSLLF